MSLSDTLQDSVEMPQTNKSASGGSVLSVPDQGEPPPQEARTQVAAGGTEGRAAAEDQGDPEIIKSPSDPKKYRWVGAMTGLCVVLIFDVNITETTRNWASFVPNDSGSDSLYEK